MIIQGVTLKIGKSIAVMLKLIMKWISMMSKEKNQEIVGLKNNIELMMIRVTYGQIEFPSEYQAYKKQMEFVISINGQL